MSTRPKRRFSPSLAATVLAVASSSGCSLLFHADATQCSTDSDCVARGAAFAGHVCRAGSCVIVDAGSDASTPPKDASVESGRDTGVTMEAAVEAAVEAETAPPGCKTNSDCTPADQTHIEVVCDRASGACLQLTTDDCPAVVGDYTAAAAPILLGAFGEFPPNGFFTHPSYVNYKMAIDEFGAAGGINGLDPVTGNPGLRTPVVVVCNASADVNRAMDHLVNDLHVPGVVAALDSITLKSVFVNKAYNNNGTYTFIINPFAADSSIVSPGLQPTQVFGSLLLWHMLGEPGDVADAYAAFFPRFESYVRTKQSLTGSTRVAAVVGQTTVTTDLAAAGKGKIRYNGMSVDDNFNQNPKLYLEIPIPSGLVQDPNAIDYTDAVNKIIAFRPNIIVSFGGPEFPQLLQRVELAWGSPTTNPLPYYLIGPYNMASQVVPAWVNNPTLQSTAARDAKRTRIAGVGIAAVAGADRHVLTSYEQRFTGPADALGQENYYDAMYFAVYSVIAAGNNINYTGQKLAQGMQRLVNSSATTYDMGPGSLISTAESALQPLNSTVGLFGTLGPPKFNLTTGARIGQGSVYCLDGGQTVFSFDVQRLSGSTVDDAGTPGLTGTFTCYSGL